MISGRACRIIDGDPEHIPEVPYSRMIEKIQAQAVLSDGKITIDTSKPGHPLWIKVSYHPDWRITEGAGELYLASPAFMLLVPRTSRVVLTFDTGLRNLSFREGGISVAFSLSWCSY